MSGLITPEDITRVKPLGDIIYEYLKKAVINGLIEPGERIIERSYAEKFNASRTPIREAIRKLEMEGLVEYVPRCGVVAKKLNPDEFAEIYAILCRLERLAIRAAVNNITQEQIQSLDKVLAKAGSVNQSRNDEQMVEQFRLFDEIILAASKMPLLIKMISRLQESLQRCKQFSLYSMYGRCSAIDEHLKIMQALRAQDAKLAEKLLCEHIDKINDRLLKK